MRLVPSLYFDFVDAERSNSCPFISHGGPRSNNQGPAAGRRRGAGRRILDYGRPQSPSRWIRLSARSEALALRTGATLQGLDECTFPVTSTSEVLAALGEVSPFEA